MLAFRMLLRHVEVGVAVDVGVAEPFEVREQDARLLLHALDQALAARGTMTSMCAVEAGEHMADRGSVVLQSSSRPRQAGALEAGDQAASGSPAPS